MTALPRDLIRRMDTVLDRAVKEGPEHHPDVPTEAAINYRCMELIAVDLPEISVVMNDRRCLLGVGRFRASDDRPMLALRALFGAVRGGCRKCGGQMQPSVATQQTYVGGMGDLTDNDIVTLSAGGPGRVMECMKCCECGWSVSI